MIERDQISARFKELYGTEPTLVSKSPGRINIIGEHTDYNEGFVLPTAIDKAVYVALSKRTDSEIHLYAEDFKEPYSVDLKEVAPSDKGWPNYILGVVNQLKNRGLELSGFNLYIDGDIPVGAGLSSSAAVECATGYGLNELFGLGLDKVEIAKIGQLAEHTYAGVKCGIMDQFASVLSKAKHVVRLDCRDLSYTYVPLELGEYEIVLLNTNVKHSLASSAYNDRRYACEHAVSLIQKKHAEVKSLRDVDIIMLDELVRPFDEDSYIKARFVVEENERLAKACDAMESGDIVEMGRQMFRAHEGLSNEYDVSCQELDFLVEKAKHFPEVLGARMMGGGFGGCTINIVKKGFGQQLVEALAPAYKNEFNLELTPIFVKTDNGSELVY
ncbi:galactokinase [Sphingobacterium mizutaii NBRC 14946 = DSM 11724]|uniref:Galactokinase n=2 Tax=Sphingobacterium mizutaii TaxID=1010 RepID=A0AAJ4XF45_9SPHI|nr:galactokinase [Sphingobacterium mizutaii]GEM66593.1 galactokinase [Sphingobacterium mizutaii NBRC 14946 = DSM 11724]SDL50592.1 galactokinase [Sphingobacterium mizutaii]SNV61596.1 Galactokinase [Sphingobacterium mizutaii]